MRFEHNIHQPGHLVMPFIISALVILLLCAVPVSAAELTAGTPVTDDATGIITIPIILKNDLGDFTGFSAKVANNIPGAIITISDERPITGAVYMVNSKEENSEQLLNALFYDGERLKTGMSDAEITLFTIDVEITNPAVTNLPLEITLRELLSASKGDIPLDTVKQIDLSNFRLTDTVIADVTSVGKPDEPGVYIPPAPVLPDQTAQPAEQPAVQPKQPASAPAGTSSSPGFGAAAGIFGLLAGAGLILRHQVRR